MQLYIQIIFKIVLKTWICEDKLIIEPYIYGGSTTFSQARES